MSNTKHTPGPWIIDRDGFNDPGALDGGDNLRRVLRWDAFARRHTDEAEANARLIAAAPELLDALQVMAKTFEGLAAIHNDAYRQARAAIAKATGQ
jgi:hypothetical protein